MVKMPWAEAEQQRAAHCLVLGEKSCHIYRTLRVKVGASSRSVADYQRIKLYIKLPQVLVVTVGMDGVVWLFAVTEA